MMSFLDPLLNPVLQPLINLSPFWAIVILALAISFLMTIAYKYLTNQAKMKELKEKQKGYQQQLKELRSQPDKMMGVQKEAMKVNLEYMKMSFKPTLFTMIPLLLIFSWMSGHLMYEPIYPSETYSITATFKEGAASSAELIPDAGTEVLNGASQPVSAGTATWNLRSIEGKHQVKVKIGSQEESKDVLITQKVETAEAVALPQHSDIKQIKINYQRLKPLGGMEIFGWQPGWLGLYIIFSLVGSLAFRKVMKIY